MKLFKIPRLKNDEVLVVITPGPLKDGMADSIEMWIEENVDEKFMFFDPRVRMVITKRDQVHVVQGDVPILCDIPGCTENGLYLMDGDLYCLEHMKAHGRPRK